ncbi:MAG: EcsC family protein [Armatimonadetes bacterium]|nr:EcsC family protein [Armatimonadota bacterium]
MDYSWTDYLTPDETAILAEVDDWVATRPGIVGRMIGLAGKPFDFAYSKIPQSVQGAISQAVLKALTTMRDGTASLVSRKAIFQQIEALSGPLEGAGGLLKVNVRILDRVAQDLTRKNRNACTVEGAAAGAAGLPGLALDIPALYGLLFKLIQETATCYGFPVKPPQERAHILKILDIGHHLDSDTKKAGMAELQTVQEMIRQGTPVHDLERYALHKGLQAMATNLAVSLTRRKLAQSAFIVGGLVGAGVNRMMASDIGEVAFHAYRRRFLMEVALSRMA